MTPAAPPVPLIAPGFVVLAAAPAAGRPCSATSPRALSSPRSSCTPPAAAYLGGGIVSGRPTSITWTFPSTDVPARQLVLAVRLVADRR